MIKQLATVMAAFAVLAVASTAYASEDHGHEHEGDIIVGHNGGTPSQLMVEGPFETHEGEEHIHVELMPVTPGAALTGFTADYPGFDHLHDDEPAESFYSLGTGASIWFRVLAIDPGLVIRQASDGAVLADAVGETALIGDEELHTHFVFNAANANLGDEFMLEIELFDNGTTGYATSAPIEFHLEAVPEPASLALLGLGGLALIARRRRA